MVKLFFPLWMKLNIKPYSEQKDNWVESRVILAQYDAESVVVYFDKSDSF